LWNQCGESLPDPKFGDNQPVPHIFIAGKKGAQHGQQISEVEAGNVYLKSVNCRGSPAREIELGFLTRLHYRR